MTTGAPMRNIAPCGSCHGDIDNKAGSPWLGGQSAVYIKAQLHAFASGTRRNDISQQMRNVARQMTTEEIDRVARYYEAQPWTSKYYVRCLLTGRTSLREWLLLAQSGRSYTNRKPRRSKELKSGHR